MRYSMSVRSRFDPNNPSSGALVAQGIGQAIQSYSDYQQGETNEENQMAAAGATAVPGSGTTPGQRFRSLFHLRSNGSPGGAQPAASQGAAGPGASGDTFAPRPDLSGAPTMPDDAFAPRGGGDRVTPGDLFAGNAYAASAPTQAPTRAPAPAAPAAAPSQSRTPQTIGSAIAPYTVKGPTTGRSYQVDPLYGARVQSAEKGMERDTEQQDQIDALVAAGMPRVIATAKVKNGVVKYDEQFGQQHPGVMSQKDRLEIQNRIDARAARAQALQRQLANMRQAGSDRSAQAQAAAAELRQVELGDENDRALLSADDAAAARATTAANAAAQNPIVDPTVAAGLHAKADSLTARADSSRARVGQNAARPHTGAGGPPLAGQPGAGKRTTINQAQYDKARKMVNPRTRQPYTAAELQALGYDFAPGVRP